MIQVQIRVVDAVNLTAPDASVFATFTFRGVEIARTETAPPVTAQTGYIPTSTQTTADRNSSPDILREKLTLDQEDGQRVRMGIAGPHTVTSTSSGAEDASHLWIARESNSCVIPLPEECAGRREVEIEIDLWEEIGAKGERGNHLGQVIKICLCTP